MRGPIIAAIASLGIWGFAAVGPVEAQPLPGTYPGSYGNPTLSPYLNLLRTGGAPAINYYGLVRPQQAYYNAFTTLEQQVAASRVAAAAAENQAAPATGHPITFLNYQKFFLNTGAVSPFQNVQATSRALASGAVQGGQAAGATPGARSSYGAGYGLPGRRY
jgi:hypothetical protein